MSALGHKRTCQPEFVMSALPPIAAAKADIGGYWPNLNWGRAFLLCPEVSDVDLLRYSKGIVHLDAKISDSTLYLGVAEQELDGSQIPGAPIN